MRGGEPAPRGGARGPGEDRSRGLKRAAHKQAEARDLKPGPVGAGTRESGHPPRAAAGPKAEGEIHRSPRRAPYSFRAGTDAARGCLIRTVGPGDSEGSARHRARRPPARCRGRRVAIRQYVARVP